MLLIHLPPFAEPVAQLAEEAAVRVPYALTAEDGLDMAALFA